MSASAELLPHARSNRRHLGHCGHWAVALPTAATHRSAVIGAESGWNDRFPPRAISGLCPQETLIVSVAQRPVSDAERSYNEEADREHLGAVVRQRRGIRQQSILYLPLSLVRLHTAACLLRE